MTKQLMFENVPPYTRMLRKLIEKNYYFLIHE